LFIENYFFKGGEVVHDLGVLYPRVEKRVNSQGVNGDKATWGFKLNCVQKSVNLFSTTSLTYMHVSESGLVWLCSTPTFYLTVSRYLVRNLFDLHYMDSWPCSEIDICEYLLLPDSFYIRKGFPKLQDKLLRFFIKQPFHQNSHVGHVSCV